MCLMMASIKLKHVARAGRKNYCLKIVVMVGLKSNLF